MNSYRMTLAEWLEFPFPANELIIGGSALDHSDSHQPHPIGLCPVVLHALPEDPAEFKVHSTNKHWANAVFRTKTTRNHADVRGRAVKQIKDKGWIKKIISHGDGTHPVGDTIKLYGDCKFTISPKGAGYDCYRHYEALIWKSVPIVLGHDSSLRHKYAKLPVIFVDSYSNLTPMALHNLYERMLWQQYDFSILRRSYWLNRRPDVNLQMQMEYWMKKYHVYNTHKQYLEALDEASIDSSKPLSGGVYH